MRTGDLKLWRSPIVCWSLCVAFSVISALMYRARTVRPLMRPEDAEHYLRDTTVLSIVAAMLAAASLFFALRTRKRPGNSQNRHLDTSSAGPYSSLEKHNDDHPFNQYPDEEFPWNFYFNGVLMPKWGACWGLAGINRFLEPDKHWDNDIGHRDVYLIGCRIDHVGMPESAAPETFVYVVQEILCILLSQRDAVIGSIRTSLAQASADEVYQGLLSAAIQMRRLASEQRVAFWTSGHDPDRLRLVASMELAQLPTSDPRHVPPPHVRQLANELSRRIKDQRSRLHRLAQSGHLPKDMRNELHSI